MACFMLTGTTLGTSPRAGGERRRRRRCSSGSWHSLRHLRHERSPFLRCDDVGAFRAAASAFPAAGRAEPARPPCALILPRRPPRKPPAPGAFRQSPTGQRSSASAASARAVSLVVAFQVHARSGPPAGRCARPAPMPVKPSGIQVALHLHLHAFARSMPCACARVERCDGLAGAERAQQSLDGVHCRVGCRRPPPARRTTSSKSAARPP